MESSINDVPEELLIMIFLLQPMNSLVLLRNVCKLWDQITSCQYFNEFLLARERTSSNTNKYLVLQGARGSKSTSLVDSDKYIYHDIPIKNYECYGICDGLLCLAPTKDCLKANSKIILWNPIFRKILPPLDVEHSQLTYLCFGYHGEDYKVIKLVFFPSMYYVCIYSLSTDSWKVVEFDGIVYSEFEYDYLLRSWSKQYPKKGTLVNGIAYFACDFEILPFDLNSEIFGEPIIFGNNSRNIIMDEYRESLVIVSYAGRENDTSWSLIDLVCSMWVLKETDNSWDEILLFKGESIYEYQNRNYEYQPVGFINEDELIIRSTTPNTVRKYSFFMYSVENSCVRPFTSQEMCETVVKSSSNVESFIRVGVKDEVRRYIKPIHAPTRQTQQPREQLKKKKVASSSNSFAALADSGDDLFVEDI